MAGVSGIAANDVRALFTKTLIDVFQSRLAPTSFLTNFFKSEVVPTKEVSIEVERMGEFVAVDVVRGTEGQRNQFARSTEKIFVPPLYREYFDMTELDLYDRVLGSQGNAQLPLWNALMLDASDRLDKLVDKIRRAKELQASQVMETGVITFKNQTSVDFKRKAGSVVDLSAPPNDGGAGTSYTVSGYWDTLTTDLFSQIEQACIFIRAIGKSGDGRYVMVCGNKALEALKKNTVFTTRQNLFHMQLDQVHAPIRNAEGATYHGTLTAGSFQVDIFAYPQFYNDPNNSDALTPYVNTKKVMIFPENPRWRFAHAAVPRLIGQPGQLPAQGEYVMQEFLDERFAKHVLDVQSAPIAIPVAVDQMVTLKVLG